MSLDRQEKALREFKQIIQDLVHLLRASTGSELAYLCWVNKERQQFVWETNSTNLPNVMFQDRVPFQQYFLDDYKEIEEITQLRVGEDVPKTKLMHYFDMVQAESLLIIPFINKGETVALTVLESEHVHDIEQLHNRIASYNNALVNVLNTYLEIVDLHENQKEWEEYEESLNLLDYRMHRVGLVSVMLAEMQKLLPDGGAVVLCPGMETWNVVLKSEGSVAPPPMGMLLEEKSVAYEALEAGKPHFSMHFNNNPRRISSTEKRTEGATFAIPILVHDRRQGVVVCYDSDPLVFKESTKHKLINLARITSLCIQSTQKKKGLVEDLMTQNFGAYMPELWEKTLETELAVQKKKAGRSMWFGFITPEDLPALRTQFRLEELQRIQHDFVALLNPSRHGVPGFMGYNSDYVYAFIIQSENENAVADWIGKVRDKTTAGINLYNGNTLRAGFLAGYTRITGSENNTYQIIEKAKKALSKAMNQKTELQEG